MKAAPEAESSSSRARTNYGSEMQQDLHEKPSMHEPSAEHGGILDSVKQFVKLYHASRRPLPTETGDGSYIENDSHASIWDDLRSVGIKDANTVKDIVESQVSRLPVDDKTMLMERTIQLVAKLPSDSRVRDKLTHIFLTQLWDSLPHPPLSFVGDKYQYRAADGSNNNPTLPWLGAANTEYARSIEPASIRPARMPDPGLVFDSIFARNTFTPHPNKVSSIFFTWASLIIHDIFQTGHPNQEINKTSSYLDLSILYGDNQEDQDMMRTFEDGKIKPDSFSEERLQALPAACGVILVMLNRFHNYVVEQLAEINENGRFTKPDANISDPVKSREAWEKYDNDLFQTGRLVTCGLYMNITLYDYLRTIVNLNRTNSTWCLDPRATMENDKTPMGLGNQCSVEFNLAYRWHSTISQMDEKWSEEAYRKFVGKPGEEASLEDLKAGMRTFAGKMDKDPSKRTFADLERQADGTFRDEDLVGILTKAIEAVSGSFGARNVPKVLRSVEIMGMEQARKWNVGSLNEFRRFFDLQPYQTFEEINSDPEVADQLRHLYEHPDYVELYPGIVAEEPKDPMVPGVGIAPGYTVSRAVLSDAVALVRGDRFYTRDYNARNLTNWGYTESMYDMDTNQGCVFYKLALRAFPQWFKGDSIYVHYPMTVPSENQEIMRDLGREQDYSWDPPAYTPARTEIFDYANVRRILEDGSNFRVTWGEATAYVFGRQGWDFMLSGDSSLHSKQRETMAISLYRDQWHHDVKQFYTEITHQLLAEKSCRLGNVNQVDISRDVGNLAHVHFASNIFSLPLKSHQHPHGIFTEHQMYMIMAAIFTAIFFDVDPAKSLPLRHKAREAAEGLGKIVESNVRTISSWGFVSSLIDGVRTNKNSLSEYGVHMVRRLLDSGLDASEVTWSQILPTAIAMAPNQAQVFTQIIDYYLSDEGKQHLPAIHRLAQEDTPETDEKLLHYCMEGIRLNGIFGSYRESRTNLTVEDKNKTVQIEPGDIVF
ncbi:heme peroxidase, partial [Aspergillus avenaceus]